MEDQHGTVTAGMVSLALATATQRYGIERRTLLQEALLDEEDVDDPGAALPCGALWDLWRFVITRSGDAAFGLRMAETLDLRLQGFWGYALIASLTLRQRIEIHQSHQPVRGPIKLSFREQGGVAVLDTTLAPLAEDLKTVLLDWGFGAVCITHHRRLRGRDPELQLWLSVKEQPHHRELREWARGPIVFKAPCNRVQFPAWHLDLPLEGDPHLAKLARAQLDARREAQRELEQADLVSAVRRRLSLHLHEDPSIERVAGDMRVSTRTLRRHLSALGVSFQGLLEELRRSRAIAYVKENEAIESIAARLGYADPSNFRRAFKRWTGHSPRHFRARQRSAQSSERTGPEGEPK